MFKLTHFGVDNFRCFKTTGLVPLNPLSIFIGKNSSGKSSYLRLFPLLRQSIEEKTKGPVLWNGNFVDFGSFEESKHNNSDENIIYFKFRVVLKTLYSQQRRRRDVGQKADIILGVACDGKTTVAKILKLTTGINNFEIEFSGNKVIKCCINDYNVQNLDDLIVFNKNRFIPEIMAKKKISYQSGGEIKTYFTASEFNFFSKVDKLAISELRQYFHHRTADATILKGVFDSKSIAPDYIDSHLQYIYRLNQNFLENYAGSKADILERYLHYSFIYNLTNIFEEIDDSIKSYFKNVKYIGPLRAIAERYYRYKDLQADEVDHTGSNLPMVLNSLTPLQRERFETWTKQNFDFVVRLKEEGWHYAIKIQVGDDCKEYNINDMGFGYSQLLPIVTSLWLENFIGQRASEGIIFVIEQPELHLHPAFQSKLALMFCKVIKFAREHKRNVKIIFETHSKAMIDTIGECIEDGIIKNEDVTIAVVDKDNFTESSISFPKFDEEGNLSGWPIGFFSGRL